MSAASALRFVEELPEPSRFWIRHAPREWPGADGWWLDLAHREFAGSSLRADVEATPPESLFTDVVYIPATTPGGGLMRQRLLEACATDGIPVVVQILPGEAPPACDGVLVVDLSTALLQKRLAKAAVPAGVWCVWPLLSGLTDDPRLVTGGLDLLAAAGAAGVRPVVPDLGPTVRRRLAEFGDVSAYRGLFHRRRSGLRDFLRAAVDRGLEVLPARPPLKSGRRQANRELAAHFALLAELWLSCGRAEGRAQELFRIGRRLEEEPADLRELVRRGGLGSVDWLDAESRREVEHLAAEDPPPSPLLAELERELWSGDR